MLKRILTAAIGVVIITPFLVFSDTWALVVMTLVLSCVGVGEMLNCTGMLKNIPLDIILFSVTIAAQILPRLIDTDKYMVYMLMIYLVTAVCVMTMAVFSKGKYKLAVAAQNIVMTMYISFGFACLILLRDMQNGLILMLWALILPWICDALAYFVGVFFGKHKMIPDVSPKKTIEGAVGGVVGAMVFAVIYALVMQFGFKYEPNYLMFMIVSFVGAFVGQWGDLIASLLKREYNLKDYGSVFPGHGGVLDRFDSNIAVAVFIFVVCKLFENVAIF